MPEFNIKAFILYSFFLFFFPEFLNFHGLSLLLFAILFSD
ncbi:hypothetical protein HMPREF6123_0018 [Oribacterium sinus F0268]|uniref:Uncharacterized protein n=1 Tax=Oribacterium sinus F0268 TaxID=585501 RepID=C2KU49_9FIRM|nr:hypothetical protein HMPREF6123_0018 [Oribacterium sinus F0268]